MSGGISVGQINAENSVILTNPIPGNTSGSQTNNIVFRGSFIGQPSPQITAVIETTHPTNAANNQSQLVIGVHNGGALTTIMTFTGSSMTLNGDLLFFGGGRSIGGTASYNFTTTNGNVMTISSNDVLIGYANSGTKFRIETLTNQSVFSVNTSVPTVTIGGNFRVNDTVLNPLINVDATNDIITLGTPVGGNTVRLNITDTVPAGSVLSLNIAGDVVALSTLPAGLTISTPILVNPSFQGLGAGLMIVNSGGQVSSSFTIQNPILFLANSPGVIYEAFNIQNSSLVANSQVSLKMTAVNSTNTALISGVMSFNSNGFAMDRSLTIEGILSANRTANGTFLSITPGVRADVATVRAVQYNIIGTGLHFFWDPVEIDATLLTNAKITARGTLASGNFEALELRNLSPNANSNVSMRMNSNNGGITGTITLTSLGFVVDRSIYGNALFNPNPVGTTIDGINITGAPQFVTLRCGQNSTTRFGATFELNCSGIIQKITAAFSNGINGVMTERFEFVPTAFQPSITNNVDLGSSALRFRDVYTVNPVNSSSDQRIKQNISITPLGLEFINALNPVKYQLINGESGRYHHGLIAQQVKSVMDEQSISTMDFAGFVYSQQADVMALRYTEFIAPMIKAIQQLSAEQQNLRTEIAHLRARLNA